MYQMQHSQCTRRRRPNKSWRILNPILREALTFMYVTILPNLSNLIIFKTPRSYTAKVLPPSVDSSIVMKSSNGIDARTSTGNLIELM
jgi:hypothetical protein